MDNQPPKCDDCGQYMFEKGVTGAKKNWYNGQGDCGVQDVKIFQCPECKEIAVK